MPKKKGQRGKSYLDSLVFEDPTDPNMEVAEGICQHPAGCHDKASGPKIGFELGNGRQETRRGNMCEAHLGTDPEDLLVTRIAKGSCTFPGCEEIVYDLAGRFDPDSNCHSAACEAHQGWNDPKINHTLDMIHNQPWNLDELAHSN
jgi:hypothetical protein